MEHSQYMPDDDDRKPENLEALIGLLEEVGEREDRVSVNTMLQAVGQRTFGPLLMVPGLIALSPLSGIPGMPSTVGIMVLIIAGQLLLGRRHFWLPQWVLNRSVPQAKLLRALCFLKPVARTIDRLTAPRLRALTRNGAIYLVSLMAIAVAVTMPPLELVPFAATTAGAALTFFGLALIAHDGLLVVVAALFYGASLLFIFNAFL